MKQLLLIYNPGAGDKDFRYALDPVVQIFQNGGYAVRLLRVPFAADAASYLWDCDAVIVAGGDGSANMAANMLMRRKQYGLSVPPLGIIPAGTANDFAGYIKMPKDPCAAAEAIINGRVLHTDLGLVNGRYFINVCGAGLFTNISQQIDAQFKDSLGMLAYYLKGIEQLQNIAPIPLRITTPAQSSPLDARLYLFIVLNGCGAGGLDKLSPGAKIDDGQLEFIGLRAVSVMDLVGLLFKLLKGDYLDDENVIFLRGDAFDVELIPEEPGGPVPETDVDGEQGPDLPVRITCVKEALPLFVPEAYR